MSDGLQELLALGLVVIVVALEALRRWRRRKAAASGCDGCGKSDPPPKEAPLRFHRRRPS
jgi:hypothetical protein